MMEGIVILMRSQNAMKGLILIIRLKQSRDKFKPEDVFFIIVLVSLS